MDFDFNRLLEDMKTWFAELPGKFQVWSDNLVKWLQDLPENTKYFIDHFPEIMQDCWDKTQKYFKSLDKWEWTGWGGEAAGFIMVLLAIILW
ncbi:hypothetical protein JW826_04795 [Candidatus Woesearchaeota archaeon]|nr:hypothetical protein [Candidatus Woesearchaeota archaeon]